MLALAALTKRLARPGQDMQALAGILDILRAGHWLTHERVRRVAPALVCGYPVSFGFLAITANGFVDAFGRPLGTDFSNVYAAGTYVLEGKAYAPFDPALQYAREQAIFGADTPFYGWHYPPFFLFVAAARWRSQCCWC